MTAAALEGLRPHNFKIHGPVLILTAVAINILALGVPVATLQIYDRVLRNHATATLQILAIGIACVIVLDISIRLTRSYLLALNGASYVHRVSSAAIEHILNADLLSTRVETVGGGLNNLGAIKSLRDFFSGQSLTVFVDLAFVPVYLMLIFYIGGLLVFVPIFVVAWFVATSVVTGFKLKDRLEQRRNLDEKRYDFLIRTLDAVHSVKAFAAEYFQVRRYETLLEQSCRANHQTSMIAIQSFNAATAFSSIMTIAVIGAGAYQVVYGHLTVGALIAIVLIAGRIMQPVQKGLSLWIQFQDFDVSKSKVEKLFAQSSTRSQLTKFDPENNGHIRLENVCFQYGPDTPLALKNITLELHAGDTITITGDAGSGKSTLLKLMAGIYKPTAGAIEIDGISMEHVSSEAVFKNVGYLGTAGTIFRGSIRENITRFGAVPFGEALEVIAALDLRDEFISLPNGFDTRLIGTAADPISPGTKQLIAMLRVLVGKPKVVLFDSAGMLLDQKSYRSIYRILAMLKGQATLVIASGDKNFSNLADDHYILKDGTLIDARQTAQAKLSVIKRGRNG